MTNYQLELVVFDLDGTLVKSDENIFQAMKLALGKVGVSDEMNRDKFTKSIGHHFKDMFSAMDLEVERYDDFVEYYKSSYFDFIDRSTLYHGTEKMLEELSEMKIKVALLTTKLQEQADQIIDHFGLRKYFNEVTGRRPGIAHKPDPEPLLNICNLLEIDPFNTLMVGDTELDIRCAKNAGTASCAVSFGFRDINRIKEEKPDFIINELSEIIPIVKQPLERE